MAKPAAAPPIELQVALSASYGLVGELVVVDLPLSIPYRLALALAVLGATSILVRSARLRRVLWATRVRALTLVLLALCLTSITSSMQIGREVVSGHVASFNWGGWVSPPDPRASDGLIESVGVANVSGGATQYALSTHVAPGQLVKVEVMYFDSDLSAPIDAVSPRFTVPPNPRDRSTVITAALTDGSGARLTQRVTLYLGGVSRSSRLEFVPGSVQWRPAFTPSEGRRPVTALADWTLNAPGPLDTVPPGGGGAFAFELQYDLARIGVSLVGRSSTSHGWTSSVYGPPRRFIQIRATLTDSGTTELRDLRIEDQLPRDAVYVPASLRVVGPTGSADPTGGESLVNPRAPHGPPRLATKYVGIVLPAVPTPTNWASTLGGETASLFPGQKVTISFTIMLWPGLGAEGSSYDVLYVHSLDTFLTAGRLYVGSSI
jgi:hypothetical protein